MSRFTRSGHWRTNIYGTTFWVSGHTVDRYDWDRYSTYSPTPPPPPLPRASVVSPRAPDGRIASFTVPNATCPVCGARVFFYQNAYGSRVFFDDLGPPWPKHPCTDNELDGSGHSSIPPDPAIPTAKRGEAGIGTLHSGSNVVVDEVPVEDDYTSARQTGDGWDRCVVKKRTDRDGVAYFVVYNASDPANRSIRFSTPARADLPSATETLYLNGDLMSFFSFEDFAPQQVHIERKRTKAVSASKKRAAKRRRARKRRK